MLGRAVLSIEGVIEQLAPELDLFKLLSDKMIERLKKNLNIKQTLLDARKDIILQLLIYSLKQAMVCQ